MPDLGAHADFILWAYAGAVLAIAALCAWIIADARRVERKLAGLEAQGIRRRSGPPA